MSTDQLPTHPPPPSSQEAPPPINTNHQCTAHSPNPHDIFPRLFPKADDNSEWYLPEPLKPPHHQYQRFLPPQPPTPNATGRRDPSTVTSRQGTGQALWFSRLFEATPTPPHHHPPYTRLIPLEVPGQNTGHGPPDPSPGLAAQSPPCVLDLEPWRLLSTFVVHSTPNNWGIYIITSGDRVRTNSCCVEMRPYYLIFTRCRPD